MSLEVSKDLTLMLQQPYNAAAAAAARVNQDMMITTSAVTASNHHDAGDAIAAAPARQCPVQLDLLPLRPLSHSITSSRAASPPQSYSTSSKLYFSWQPASVRSHGGAWPRNIDVNQIPSMNGDCDDAPVISSSPSSTAGGLKREREPMQQNMMFDLQELRDRPCEISSRAAGSDDEDGGTTRKKLRLSKEQSALLEDSFKEHSTLNPKQKNTLAKQLNLRPRQVEVWFQNRRARTKLKQTEVDCERLKRCCDCLALENRRLQKELLELRAIKVAAPPAACLNMISQVDYYTRPLPAATLTMCPSCERVSTVADNRSSPHTVFTKPGFSHLVQSSAA
ncbi:unnamed protein product [Sphagnum jensenii]|uniref:Homeobox domain-containing protein n=1 Tax=Sphagnum jensenii TaxID=128206 RepID=A0ABP0WB65_9BRYO